MKKVIKNKVYDTTTAHLSGNSPNGTLYQKKNGEFFIYTTSNGEKITPLSYTGAQEWAAQNLTDEEYKRLFTMPMPEENTELYHLNAYIKKTSYMKLRRAASQTGQTYGRILDELIEHQL